MHKGYRVRAKENDLYEHKERRKALDNWQTACLRMHTHPHAHTHFPSHARGCESKCILWNIASHGFLSRYTSADRYVLSHLSSLARCQLYSNTCLCLGLFITLLAPWLSSQANSVPFQLWECWSGNSGNLGPPDWFKNGINAEKIHDQHISFSCCWYLQDLQWGKLIKRIIY